MHKHAFALLSLPVLLLGTSAALAQQPAKPAELLPRTALGLTVEEQSADAEYGGVLVRDVAPDSPAAKAGIQKDDLIIRACNRQVDDYDDLVNTLAGCSPDEKVTFQVIRDGKFKSLKVTLGTHTGEKSEKTEGPPFLGILAMPSDRVQQDTIDRLGLNEHDGLVVIDVVPGSPAAKVGLRHGDLITSAGGKNVTRIDQLRAQLGETGTGKEAVLKVRRGESEKEVRVTPTECPVGVCLKQPAWRSPDYQQRLNATLESIQRQIERLDKRLRELEQRTEDKSK